ncbi:MAG TPA: tripartite tricarboxylate transporter substrate binding protein [Burkholderiales bacterium]|nr:tripartite tricarboxylate transporter substrate binding protein [Burkholderiales bacterium]
MRASLALLLALACALAHAQAYPAKPVRLIIPFPPGGSNDVVGRVIAAQLGERLGQGVIVDNRGGGGGTIGINAAAKSPADGYTLLFVSVGFPVSIALGQLPQEALQWFVPVAAVGTGPSLLVVPPTLPVNSLQELLALAKRKPGELNAAAAGVGSFQHLATELFRLQAGIDIVIVQYKGGGPALTDTIAGQVQLNIGSAVQNVPQVRSGKLRALGVGGPHRLSALPEVPTFAEAGLPGAEATNWWGIVAPGGTPAAALGRLQAEIAAILDSAQTQRRFQTEGADVLRMTAGEFGKHIAAETEKWTRVVKQAGIKAE